MDKEGFLWIIGYYAAKALNDKGNIAEPGYSNELVWQYDRADIKAKKIRIKEWDYYIITNQKYAIALTISDSGYIGCLSASLLSYDKQNPLNVTKSALKLFPMGKMKLPNTSVIGDVSAKFGKTEMSFKNDGKTRRLSGKYPNFKDGCTLEFDIELTDFPKDSMVIATPFNKEKHFYYNQKINCMRAKGFVKCGDLDMIFDPADSFGTLDWGRGVWTYENTWYWSSLQAVLEDGTVFGWNLGYGFGNTSAASENMVFVNGIAHKLDKVNFGLTTDANSKDQYLSKWHFTSNENRLDMIFEPIFDRQAPLDLGVIAMLPQSGVWEI
jgi:hypothetical protein